MPHLYHSFPFLISGRMPGENYISLNSSLYCFLHCTVTTSHLRPNFLSILISNTLILSPSINGRNEFSQIYEKKDYNVFYLIHHIFGKNAGRDKMIASIIWLQTALKFFLNFNTSFFSNGIFSNFIMWLPPESWVRSILTSLADSQHNYYEN